MPGTSFITYDELSTDSLQRIGFTPSDRPEDIALWVKNAREGRIVIKKPATYATQWRKWWTRINPSWRTDANGRLVIGGTGDWSCMLVPSMNGFLNVLGSLVGLRDIENDNEKWCGVVRDVRWVMSEVLVAKRARGYVCLCCHIHSYLIMFLERSVLERLKRPVTRRRKSAPATRRSRVVATSIFLCRSVTPAVLRLFICPP